MDTCILAQTIMSARRQGGSRYYLIVVLTLLKDTRPDERPHKSRHWGFRLEQRLGFGRSIMCFVFFDGCNGAEEVLSRRLRFKLVSLIIGVNGLGILDESFKVGAGETLSCSDELRYVYLSEFIGQVGGEGGEDFTS